MSEFGEKLAKAFIDRDNNINNFVWKGAKELDKNGKFVQKEIPLSSATPEELKQFHKHSKTMLFNTDKRNPGRVTLLKEISDQRKVLKNNSN